MPEHIYPRLAGLFAATLLLLMAFLAASRGWADLDRLTSEKISEQGRDLEDDDWVRAWEKSLSLLLKAHHLTPANADYVKQLGVLYKARSKQTAIPTEKEHYRTLALEHHLLALQRRPAWAAGWIRYALARYQLFGTDKETIIAMQRATELGPWEVEVLGGISWLAMQNWSELPAALQTSSWQIIRHAATHRRLSGKVKQWAAAAGWSAFLKRALRDDKH